MLSTLNLSKPTLHKSTDVIKHLPHFFPEDVDHEIFLRQNDAIMNDFGVDKDTIGNGDLLQAKERLSSRQNHVSHVLLHGVYIVCLHMDGQDRLCLAQISSTLLKNYSYNEIHNRRVALGIMCVQCTPVQLEILRRARAMPVSSRRCGMITKRESERLVRSFLDDNQPPKLPEDYSFQVCHECGWGSRGYFEPARYNSSRAKCIKCAYCSVYFSPNKFIFHFHRAPDCNYHHPDAANFNSWRRHLKLLPDDSPHAERVIHLWEDVKAMFNGGTRKKITLNSICSVSGKLCTGAITSPSVTATPSSVPLDSKRKVAENPNNLDNKKLGGDQPERTLSSCHNVVINPFAWMQSLTFANHPPNPYPFFPMISSQANCFYFPTNGSAQLADSIRLDKANDQISDVFSGAKGDIPTSWIGRSPLTSTGLQVLWENTLSHFATVLPSETSSCSSCVDKNLLNYSDVDKFRNGIYPSCQGPPTASVIAKCQSNVSKCDDKMALCNSEKCNESEIIHKRKNCERRSPNFVCMGSNKASRNRLREDRAMYSAFYPVQKVSSAEQTIVNDEDFTAYGSAKSNNKLPNKCGSISADLEDTEEINVTDMSTCTPEDLSKPHLRHSLNAVGNNDGINKRKLDEIFEDGIIQPQNIAQCMKQTNLLDDNRQQMSKCDSLRKSGSPMYFYNQENDSKIAENNCFIQDESDKVEELGNTYLPSMTKDAIISVLNEERKLRLSLQLKLKDANDILHGSFIAKAVTANQEYRRHDNVTHR